MGTSGNYICDEIREKIFKNYALKFTDAVRTKLNQVITSSASSDPLLSSPTSSTHSDVGLVLD
jgi:hypothetical protein